MTTIGIDLGTTNSLVAYWTENGPVLIPNALGETLTPSVVSVDENGEILIGKIARERLLTHPDRTASTFKRFMGTEKRYQLGRYSLSAEDLSSFVIKSLKADAEAHFGYPVLEAVISVPAYFNDTQRKATKRAAELAGLKVERLISEPTAAAISYGLHQEESETQFLVFDLGGGTFDVSILEMFEGVMEVKSIAGDNFLGGEDFTDLIASYFIEAHRLDINTLNSKTRSSIHKQAELCKRALFSEQEGKMSVNIQGELVETTLSRNQLEDLAFPLLQRLRQPIERALRDASISPRELDAIVLIGGATRMPLIKSIVSKIFGRLPYSHINPDEAVALGTAIQAALKERNEALNELVLTDVCPYTLGTGIVQTMANGKHEDGYFFPIIERNTPIPVSRVERLYTVLDYQRSILVDVYQGESRRVEHNLKLGELNVKVPPAKKGEESIDVRYTYDINGILEVEVTVVSSGVKTKAVIEKNPGSLSKQEIEERFQALQNIKIHPRERTENRLLLAKGERMYEEALGEERMIIANFLRRFESVLSTQNERDIAKAAEELKQQLDMFEGWNEY